MEEKERRREGKKDRESEKIGDREVDGSMFNSVLNVSAPKRILVYCYKFLNVFRRVHPRARKRERVCVYVRVTGRQRQKINENEIEKECLYVCLRETVKKDRDAACVCMSHTHKGKRQR